MRRLRSQFIVMILSLAATAGVAQAAPELPFATPKPTAVIPSLGINEPLAIDGTDIYGVSTGLTGFVLWRKSVNGGKREQLAIFPDMYTQAATLVAGGGRVAITSESLVGKHFVEKVISFDRHGKRRKVLSSVKEPVGFRGDYFSDGCGSGARLDSATSAGSIVISEVISTRSVSRCGPEGTAAQWRYVEIAKSGARRTIYATNAKPRLKQLDSIVRVVVNGDYAAFVVYKSLRVYVKNLKTGMVTGPFYDSVRLSKGRHHAKGTALGPNGSLLTESRSAGKNASTWTDLFPNPAEPGLAVRSKEPYGARFCGSRIFALEYDDASETYSLVELDLQTLAVKRTITSVGSFHSIEGCTESRAVVSREYTPDIEYRSYAIPQ